MLVKICCVSSTEEAEVALAHGADALGLVSEMPSGPGIIPESLISEIATTIGDRAHSVLLTSLTHPRAVADQFGRCTVNTLQLCNWLPGTARRTLRSLLPHAFIIQVVHVTGAETFDKARRSQDHIDALLLDSGTPTGATPELGGTGRTHDWSVSRQIRENVRVPVFLAGGLRACNIAEAIGSVNPYGIDVCSGVRTNGKLDQSRLRAFMAEVRRTVAV
ncbi:MAG: phosphoribosylanthranilate isomerase [Pirellulaceae bacterium]